MADDLFRGGLAKYRQSIKGRNPNSLRQRQLGKSAAEVFEGKTGVAKIFRGSLTSSQKNLFLPGTKFTNAGGHVADPFREMAIGNKVITGRHSLTPKTGGTYYDRRYMEMPSDYKSYTKFAKSGKGGRITSKPWEVPSESGVIQLTNFKQMALQMMMTSHQVPIALEHWKQAILQRAYAVFREAFQKKKFDGHRWPYISEWTKEKRKLGGAWPGERFSKYNQKYSKGPKWPKANKLLQETNALYNSLKLIPNGKGGYSSIKAEASYAGIHNDPPAGATYGDGFGGIFTKLKKVKKRQFMGHSKDIDSFIVLYESKYMFDSVFRRPG